MFSIRSVRVVSQWAVTVHSKVRVLFQGDFTKPFHLFTPLLSSHDSGNNIQKKIQHNLFFIKKYLNLVSVKHKVSENGFIQETELGLIWCKNDTEKKELEILTFGKCLINQISYVSTFFLLKGELLTSSEILSFSYMHPCSWLTSMGATG